MATSMIFGSLFLALCLASGLEASSTPFSACKSGPAPSDFRMEGCTETPCQLVRGSTARAEWDFTAVADAAKLTPRVRATLYNILTVNYDIGQDNACDTLTNAECPLDKGEDVTYALAMDVLASYPKVSLTIEFALLDENSNVHVCFSVPAQVVTA